MIIGRHDSPASTESHSRVTAPVPRHRHQPLPDRHQPGRRRHTRSGRPEPADRPPAPRRQPPTAEPGPHRPDRHRHAAEHRHPLRLPAARPPPAAAARRQHRAVRRGPGQRRQRGTPGRQQRTHHQPARRHGDRVVRRRPPPLVTGQLRRALHQREPGRVRRDPDRRAVDPSYRRSTSPAAPPPAGPRSPRAARRTARSGAATSRSVPSGACLQVPVRGLPCAPPLFAPDRRQPSVPAGRRVEHVLSAVERHRRRRHRRPRNGRPGWTRPPDGSPRPHRPRPPTTYHRPAQAVGVAQHRSTRRHPAASGRTTDCQAGAAPVRRLRASRYRPPGAPAGGRPSDGDERRNASAPIRLRHGVATPVRAPAASPRRRRSPRGSARRPPSWSSGGPSRCAGST